MISLLNAGASGWLLQQPSLLLLVNAGIQAVLVTQWRGGFGVRGGAGRGGPLPAAQMLAVAAGGYAARSVSCGATAAADWSGRFCSVTTVADQRPIGPALIGRTGHRCSRSGEGLLV